MRCSGPSDSLALQGASAQLLAWRQAFEDWMQDRRERRRDSIYWASLPPWEQL